MNAVARRSVRTWVVGLSVALVTVAIGALLVVRRAVEEDARRTAERLLGCPNVEADMVSFGDAEHWRVEGCGVRGELVCEPNNPGCFVVPDE